jgi:hypothetical protein
MRMEILAHLILAVLLQLLVVRLCKSWMAGALVASAWTISREITQAEYRWIELYGSGLRSNMPWWGGFDLRVWQRLDPWLDWLLPTILVWTLVLVAWRAHPDIQQTAPTD